MKMGQHITEHFYMSFHEDEVAAVVVCTSDQASRPWESLRHPLLDLGLLYRPIAIAELAEESQIAIKVDGAKVDRADLVKRLNEADKDGEGWSVTAEGLIVCPFTGLSVRDVPKICKFSFSSVEIETSPVE